MLIGKIILLRPITSADLPQLVEWYNDPNFFGSHFNLWPTTLERQQKSFGEHVHTDESDTYLITNREQGELMGVIGFLNTFSFSLYQAQEIWYQMHPGFRRKGLATQAACLLVNHLFDATPVNRIQANVVVGNEGSCRVLENTGMQKEGICRGIFYLHGHYTDLYLYSIVRDDWRDEATYRNSRKEF
jgi:ribosomal-protein-alanine N-acetyltransferase